MRLHSETCEEAPTAGVPIGAIAAPDIEGRGRTGGASSAAISKDAWDEGSDAAGTEAETFNGERR
jgi:hypothetical protein